MNVADALLRTARDAGIDVCFANPGTTEMPLPVALDSASGTLGVTTIICSNRAYRLLPIELMRAGSAELLLARRGPRPGRGSSYA